MSALLIISSDTAWVDPSVQVHAVDCAHAWRRIDSGEWLVRYGPYRSIDAARADAERDAAIMHAVDVTYCDCSLFAR